MRFIPLVAYMVALSATSRAARGWTRPPYAAARAEISRPMPWLGEERARATRCRSTRLTLLHRREPRTKIRRAAHSSARSRSDRPFRKRHVQLSFEQLTHAGVMPAGKAEIGKRLGLDGVQQPPRQRDALVDVAPGDMPDDQLEVVRGSLEAERGQILFFCHCRLLSTGPAPRCAGSGYAWRNVRILYKHTVLSATGLQQTLWPSGQLFAPSAMDHDQQCPRFGLAGIADCVRLIGRVARGVAHLQAPAGCRGFDFHRALQHGEVLARAGNRGRSISVHRRPAASARTTRTCRRGRSTRATGSGRRGRRVSGCRAGRLPGSSRMPSAGRTAHRA